MEHDQKHFDIEAHDSHQGAYSSEEKISSSSPLSAIVAYLELGDTHINSEESVAALVKALKSEQWQERAEAVQRLGMIGDDGAMEPIEVALQDEKAEVRAFAARALGNTAVGVPIQPLVAILNNELGEPAKVRAAAAWALGEIKEVGGEVPIQPLQVALEDKDEDVRAAAVRALGKFGDQAPKDQLKKTLLEDPAWHPREIAALALGNIGDQSAIGSLNAALSDRNTLVRNAAAYALEKLVGGGPGGQPPTLPSPLNEPFASQKGDMKSGSAASTEERDLSSRNEVLSGAGQGQPSFSTTVPISEQPDTTSEVITPLGIVEVKDTSPLENTQGERRKPTIIRDEKVEFIALEPPNLGTVPVVAQALDNQWVPRLPLKEIMAGKFAFKNVEKAVEALVRAEYIRALVNGKQVIINRAYLYNNSAVFQDYLTEGEAYDAFKTLLQEEVIVPFLMSEKTPNQPPRYGTTPAFQKWQQLCEEVRMHCLRFSWDEDTNLKESLAQLARRFHDFALTAISGDFERYIKDLGLDPSAESELRKRFGAMARMCLEYSEEQKYVTRDDLYKSFVTAGDNTAERSYDGTRPFAGEIKQLLDLAYNSNLADALGGYLLTPTDSLPRIALQEWQRAANQPKQLSAEELVKMLKRHAFSLINEGLYLKSMNLLRLQDVIEVRRMDEWIVYIMSLEELLKNPIEFTERAGQVYQNYAKLAERMTVQVAGRGAQGSLSIAALTAPWTPTAELILSASGSSISVTWTSEGPVYTFAGEELPRVGPGGLATFSARFNIGTSSGTKSQADLFTSLEFMKGTLQDAREQWKQIRSSLKAILGRQEGLTEPEGLKEVATLNDKVPVEA